MVRDRQPGGRQRPGADRLAADQPAAARASYRARVCIYRAEVPCDRTGRRGRQQRFPQDYRSRRRRYDPRGRQRAVHSEDRSDDRCVAERDRRRNGQRLDPDVRHPAQVFGGDPRDRRRTLVPSRRGRHIVLQGQLQAEPLHGQCGGRRLRRFREPEVQSPQGGGQERQVALSVEHAESRAALFFDGRQGVRRRRAGRQRSGIQRDDRNRSLQRRRHASDARGGSRRRSVRPDGDP